MQIVPNQFPNGSLPVHIFFLLFYTLPLSFLLNLTLKHQVSSTTVAATALNASTQIDDFLTFFFHEISVEKKKKPCRGDNSKRARNVLQIIKQGTEYAITIHGHRLFLNHLWPIIQIYLLWMKLLRICISDEWKEDLWTLIDNQSEWVAKFTSN